MNTPTHGNIFEDLPPSFGQEVFEDLFVNNRFRVERIISTGQATPPGMWLDQDADEWVVLLRGAAEIRFENEPQSRRLHPGDFLLIPAHRRHRVEWTDPVQPTLWLAIHDSSPMPGSTSNAS